MKLLFQLDAVVQAKTQIQALQVWTHGGWLKRHMIQQAKPIVDSSPDVFRHTRSRQAANDEFTVSGCSYMLLQQGDEEPTVRLRGYHDQNYNWSGL